MPRLEYPTYLDHIRTESARFRAALADCDPAAKVPTCPDWDAADLLWHLAGVQLFWAKVIRHRPASPDDPAIGSEDAAERPASYAELLDAFDDYSHALATELERADPEAEAWHWSGDLRVGTSYRRQAHEAAIHRIDAELTAGLAVTPLDAALADDGVAEALGVMYGGAPEWGSFTGSGETIGVHLSDTGTRLLVELGAFSGTDPDSGTTYTDEDDIALVDDGADPLATITGTAADLDTWLWKRDPALLPGKGADDRIRVDGDRIACEKLLAILGQPIN
ncbi:maleylpyruvate isomerase family mycothiol-dependent enzyme [Nocardioides halotolerans]|uniref:maleylpyruvate isomerase family mycothiol-dependent enzyme n=1 Tax=Nocardioides halotolerans TaxID=433660 RepID=UPI00048DE300|nr:maleylpyruvate isomerase family mycothiol-dependent enzyme [Nocardioides halotolerans]